MCVQSDLSLCCLGHIFSRYGFKEEDAEHLLILMAWRKLILGKIYSASAKCMFFVRNMIKVGIYSYMAKFGSLYVKWPGLEHILTSVSIIKDSFNWFGSETA